MHDHKTTSNSDFKKSMTDVWYHKHSVDSRLYSFLLSIIYFIHTIFCCWRSKNLSVLSTHFFPSLRQTRNRSPVLQEHRAGGPRGGLVPGHPGPAVRHCGLLQETCTGPEGKTRWVIGLFLYVFHDKIKLSHLMNNISFYHCPPLLNNWMCNNHPY